MDTDAPLVLFINDATEIFLPVIRRGVNQSAILPVPSFDVWTHKTAGAQVGATINMAWDATVEQWTGIYPTSSSVGLSETVTGGPFYWLRILATGYTDRRIKCIARYRGQS